MRRHAVGCRDFARARLVSPGSLAAVAAFVALTSGCPPSSNCPSAPPTVLSVGTVPNDVTFAECDGEPVLLVPASADARLDVFSLSCGAPRGSVLFLPEGGAAANPWAVASDGELAWVTLQGQRSVALIDPCEGSVLSVARLEELLPIDPPLALSTPQDVDGDGATETEVRQLLPRAPEPVVSRDGVAWVAFTNLLEPGLSSEHPPVLGPGVLARFERSGDAVAGAPRIASLPCSNPQGLALNGDELWVSCSGPLGPTLEGAIAALDDGALLRMDPDNLAVLETVDAARFAPGTPALLEGRLVVGSLVKPALGLVAGGALTTVPIEGAAIESLFECARAETSMGARALCTHFSRDRVLVVRADDEGLVVEAELLVGQGGTLARGAQALAIAPPRAREHGVGAAVLLGLSAEVALIPTEAMP